MKTLLANLGIGLTDKQEKQFADYMALLLDWNQKFNLTAITDPEEVRIKHFYDSLLLTQASLWTGKGCLADLGSGAGFPGVPLKIICPELEVVLFEASAKKTEFLNMLCSELGLEQITAVHGRAEDAGQNNQYRGGFDWVVSRAVAGISVLAEYSLPLLKLQGVMAAYKGPGYQAELETAHKALNLLGGTYVETLSAELPKNFGQRSILLIQKTAKTPEVYPRKAGTPSKKPL